MIRPQSLWGNLRSIRAFRQSHGTISITLPIWILTFAAIRPKRTVFQRRGFLNLLRNAYSENYLYLIKKPEDQYRVIVEVKDRPAFEGGRPVSPVH